MPTIQFRNVRKVYGEQIVVPDFSLNIPSGAFVVVLGPSGCGKSTVLRMLAGLERLSGGQILIDDRQIHELPPSVRGCAMVFQNYALYPHMSVAENISYGMKLAGVPKAQRNARAEEVARSLGLSDLMLRRPFQLSGGQRQRVAIGRAIAREPSVLLFDEPLSNLDAQLRGETRIELAALHKRILATSLFVTHDQVEAMTLADLIVVMNRGRIEQVGTPAQVYDQPDSVFVAQFVGSPPMNLLRATVQAGCVCLDGNPDLLMGHVEGPERQVRVGLRPEAIRLGQTGIGATIIGIERHGREIVYYLDTNGGRVASVQPDDRVIHDVGAQVRLVIDVSKACLFENDGDGRRVGAFRRVPVGDKSSLCRPNS